MSICPWYDHMYYSSYHGVFMWNTISWSRWKWVRWTLQVIKLRRVNSSDSWDTSIKGTPPFRGQKIWSLKNVHIIFESVTSIERTPLFRGKGHVFWVRNPGLTSFRGHLSTQNMTDHKEVLISLSVHWSQLWELSETELSHLNWCNPLMWIQHIISQR